MAQVALSHFTQVAWDADAASASAIAPASYPCIVSAFNPEIVESIPDARNIGQSAPMPDRPGARRGAVQFARELVGQTAKAVPPRDGALLRACGAKEASSGSTYAAYIYTFAGPVASEGNIHLPLTTVGTGGDLDPVDLEITIGASTTPVKHLVNKCVGNVVFDITPGQYPIARYDFVGKIPGVGDTPAGVSTSALAGNTNAAATAQGTDGTSVKVGTATYTLNTGGGAVNMVGRSLSLDMGNAVFLRPSISGEFGYTTPIIAMRDPVYTAVVEVPLKTSMDFESAFVAGTSIAFIYIHNVGATKYGQQITFAGDMLIRSAAAIGDDGGAMVYTLTMGQNSTVGKNPFTVTYLAQT